MLGVVITDAMQGLGIALFGIKAAESNRLIAPQTAGRVDRTAFDHVKFQVVFAADHKESARLGEASQPSEIQITSAHHVHCSGLERQLVQDVDLVNCALCQSDKCWDGAAQLQEGMQFDRRFRRTKMSSREKPQAQIDHPRIQSVNGLIQFECERLCGVKFAGSLDQGLSPVRVDAPVSALVGIG